jgi:hypothetical protein
MFTWYLSDLSGCPLLLLGITIDEDCLENKSPRSPFFEAYDFLLLAFIAIKMLIILFITTLKQ